ncbi:tRNA (adenosine(37)-N6)-dimethylallyltransferase MiaA [Rhizosaccharibacter radicis]|uniref:tRNA dimethylallyltransferase n=1 Tax=Rhizosaccharibacter radicis TaxID=2782605 RepID=A0ABT1W2V6_9PROT|nr:tRNA (adenosine(37)-N6)-dimethylallyltransferase MiaA [Acetobacteraceae bacterium KSS12]
MAEAIQGRQDGLPPALIVCGPTCSGKSALAFRLAERHRGTVINADSMQVYRDLRVLTARPTPDEERRVPHRLYGVRDAASAGNAAWWRGQAVDALREAWTAGRLPILCGGTGMYLSALLHGLAPVPDPGEAARAEARDLLEREGPGALHERLAAVDPATAATLRPTDGQRLARAWEVWRGTGRGLAAWHGEEPAPPVAMRAVVIRLDPSRDVLRRALADRFAAMMAEGALDEVRALLARRLPPELPAMRAHGVPELAALLRGELPRAEAERRAVAAQNRYIKRQSTWFRHQFLLPAEQTIVLPCRMADMTQQMESDLASTMSFVIETVDDGGGPA